MLTYLRKELFQLVWHKLLDDELMAYGCLQQWLRVECIDGVSRLLFPRIITYSGDYPERCVLLFDSFASADRDTKGLPSVVSNLLEDTPAFCVSCRRRRSGNWGLIPISQTTTIPADLTTIPCGSTSSQLAGVYSWERASRVSGSRSNSTANRLLRREYVLDIFSSFLYQCCCAERLLREARTRRILPNFRMLAPDLMHEVEIGTWKALFTHLVRMLSSISHTVVARLNARQVLRFEVCFTSRPLAIDIGASHHLGAKPFAAFPTTPRR